jgi:predicted  nucleic acid-binding Zn-ribbon protein
MTEQHRKDLKELQQLDVRLEKAKRRIAEFDPRLEEVELPALTLESELGTARSRIQEMKLEERRLELAAEEKRVRRQKLEERLGSVRNLREEAAVSAELEMVKRAMQNDEQEALGLIDQLRKAEERHAELDKSYREASEVLEPKRNELLADRTAAQKELEELRKERTRFAATIDKGELRTYDAIRAGGRTVAVADLTDEGACGHCFGMVPLQLRNEVRHGNSLIRCEGCGVILTPPADVAVAEGRTEA